MISESTLAVYAVHESDYISKFLWDGVFHFSEWYNSGIVFIPVLIEIILTVFLVCTGIDLVLRPVYTVGAKKIEGLLVCISMK
jgi:hypothetical protein